MSKGVLLVVCPLCWLSVLFQFLRKYYARGPGFRANSFFVFCFGGREFWVWHLHEQNVYGIAQPEFKVDYIGITPANVGQVKELNMVP